MDEAALILRSPSYSPDLPAPRRPRIARLTSRGTLCGPLPARGLPNTDDMAKLQMATPVSRPDGLLVARPQSLRLSVSARWRRGVDGAWPPCSNCLLKAAEPPARAPCNQGCTPCLLVGLCVTFALDHSQLTLSTLLLCFAWATPSSIAAELRLLGQRICAPC